MPESGLYSFLFCFLFYFESLVLPLYRIFTSPPGFIECLWVSPVSCSPVYLNPPSLWFPFFVCLVVRFFSQSLSVTSLSAEDKQSTNTTSSFYARCGVSMMAFIGRDKGSGRWILMNMCERAWTWGHPGFYDELESHTYTDNMWYPANSRWSYAFCVKI